MQFHLLPLLACPLSGTSLDCRVISSDPDSGEIMEGILLSPMGPAYPVRKGVPRLLPDAIEEHSEFLKQHLSDFEERRQKVSIQFSTEIQLAERKNRRSRASFSTEWKDHQYDESFTWNQDAAGQEQQFYSECAESADSISGKLILDAGCGNGQLAMRLAKAGARVLAMDFSEAVEMAAAVNPYVDCHFMQADVEFPPLQREIFSLIYCSGVLIHTRNTRNSFQGLLPYLTVNGRLSIWVYRRREEWLHRLFNQVREQTSRLPEGIQLPFLRFLVFYPALLIKRWKNNPQPSSGLWVEVLDWFTPEYRHEHQEEEVILWFQEAGLQGISISDRNHWGFSVLGEKRISGKELQGIFT
jgi:SAM-dependent methyltransferase